MDLFGFVEMLFKNINNIINERLEMWRSISYWEDHNGLWTKFFQSYKLNENPKILHNIKILVKF